MDEKIEQLAKDLKLIKELQASDIYTANYQEARALFSLGYRKESDTAREILTLIKNGVELNSMIDGDAKIAIMNELRWAGQKYGINFTNS